MKVFLTGSTGYLGERLARGLLEAGHEVRALVRHPDAMPSELRERMEIVQGDLLGTMDTEFLAGADAMIHCAAMVRTWHRNRSIFDRVNVTAYEKLLRVAVAAGVGKILHTSSFIALGPSADGTPMAEDSPRWGGPPMTDYERTKMGAERVSRRFVDEGGPLVSLYPAVIYGPGRRTEGNLLGKLAFMIRTGTFPGLLGTGRQRWTLAFVEDVVLGHLLALEKGVPGDRFILGGPDVVLADLVGRLQELLGKPKRKRTLPIAVGKAVGWAQVLRAFLGGPVPELTPGIAEVYRHDWLFSSDRAREKLGYEVTPLTDGLERTARWVQGIRSWEGGLS